MQGELGFVVRGGLMDKLEQGKRLIRAQVERPFFTSNSACAATRRRSTEPETAKSTAHCAAPLHPFQLLLPDCS